jgi:hypothetical protein
MLFVISRDLALLLVDGFGEMGIRESCLSGIVPTVDRGRSLRRRRGSTLPDGCRSEEAGDEE